MSHSSCVLSTTELCFSYGGRNTVDRVNLQLQAGRLSALVGPNGAGKSTLLHLLEGRLKPSQGTVNSSKPIGLMPQRAAIDWSFPITARDMVQLGAPRKGKTTAADHCDQLLERVGMGAMGSQRLNQLSGGQQQRVLLARALMQQTEILLAGRTLQRHRSTNARAPAQGDAGSGGSRPDAAGEQPRLGQRPRQLRPGGRDGRPDPGQRITRHGPRKTERSDLHDGEFLAVAEPDIWWLLPLTISLLIGAICPATGALLITQRRVLLANLMAHSVLPGLVIALAIGIEPSIGGLISGLLGALVAERLNRRFKGREEGAMNTVLAGFTALGVLLVPLLDARVDLETILFGDLLAANTTDLLRTALSPAPDGDVGVGLPRPGVRWHRPRGSGHRQATGALDSADLQS